MTAREIGIMVNPTDSQFLDDPEFQALLVACLESLQRGETIDRDALAQQYPEFAVKVEQFLEDRQLLQQVAVGFGDVEPSHFAVLGNERTVGSSDDLDEFAVGDTIGYIGEYEILEMIARGGMGIVFKARQQKLRRIVALKMILAGRLADDSDVKRFRREAQAAGRLKHPNIVSVHEIGEHEGRHYFTMDFIDGHSLAEEIREEPLPPRQAAEIVLAAAKAVQYAHEQGTVHRDLKPANLLLAADGAPLITDFGLAKILDSVDEQSRAELTASGQILGTPSYMSPEQALGKVGSVGKSADIYALGAILYACLTGRAPFVADTPVDTLFQVMRNEPVSPRSLNSKVPKDLETICLKCLEKDPHKRYVTATFLADDLQRYLQGRSILARPAGRMSKAWRWCRRNPLVACLLALTLVSLVTGLGFATHYAAIARRQAAAEAVARGTAEQRLDRLTRTHYALQLTRVQSLWRSAPDEAVRLLDDTLSCPSNLRDFSWHYLHRLADTEVERWRDQPGPLKAVDISPDQTLFAAGGLSRSVQVWKRGRKRPVAVLSDHDGWVSSLCFSHDGRLLATASQQTVTVWNVSTSQIVRRIEHGGEVDCVGYTGDGKLLISAGNGIAVWDAATGNLVRRLADESRRIHHMVLATTSQRMLTAQHNGVLELWELDQSKPPRTIATPGCPITCLDMSKDETRFLFNDRFVVHVHNLADGEEICQLRQADETRLGEWRTARFSPDGQMIAAGSGGDPIKLWDAETGLARLVLTPRLGSVDAMQFTSNGSSLVTGDHAGAVTLWRISPHDGNRVTELSGSRLAVSPNGRFVAATDQLQVAVLETSKGSVISSLKVGGVINLRFSPSSGLLAGLLEGGEIRLWNPASGREVARKKNETRGEALAFIDDDSLAFSSGDSGIAVWDLPDGDMYQLDGGGQAVLCLAVAPDGHQLAAGHGIHPLPDKTPPGKVVVWNLETKRQLATLKGHSSFGVYGVDFSSDGKMLASCGDGLLLWETRNYQQLNAITGHTAPIWSVSFSPDGRAIATASMDTTVRLWDPQSGEQRLSLVGHTGWVTAVGFAPNSRNLYSAGFDRKVRSWPGDEHLLGAGAKP